MGIRRIGFGVLALAAIVITFVAGPQVPETSDTSRYDRQIQQALDDYESNDARTEGAPQQQVVNGWIARDLLTVIAEQGTDSLAVATPAATDDRVPLLLLVLVLSVCWYAFTAPSQPESATVAGGPVSGPEPHSAEPATTSTAGTEPPSTRPGPVAPSAADSTGTHPDATH